MSNVRVRFAPSPTGELHIGGARTALFNLLYARANNGLLVLRIDDTDLERSREDYVEKLMDSLRWLGLEWDEGPYYQSRRQDHYTAEKERMLAENKAYRCYCSTEELARGRDEAKKENRAFLYPGTCRKLSPEAEEKYRSEGRNPVIRVRTPDSGETVVDDLIRGKVYFENAMLDDFIIMKSNGQPTYNFASVVDDLLLNITHVIRAEEHLSNTPRQQLCALALGYELPAFAHVPMILAPDRSKLSKRHGATSVEEFQNEGYLPEALINYMALLGWSPGDDRELLKLEEMITAFNLNKVNKTAAIYDVNKLAWMNGHYIRDKSPDQLAEAALPFFKERGLLEGEMSSSELDYLKRVLNAVRERARTLKELAEATEYFYLDDFEYDPKGIKKAFQKEGATDILRSIRQELCSLEDFNEEKAEALFHEMSEKTGLSFGRLIQPTRLALTGRMGGPGLFEIMSLLGKDKTLSRLDKAISYIESGRG
ncbi:MAG: glutamate--tRNA ligase [Bacillota bacterium]